MPRISLLRLCRYALTLLLIVAFISTSYINLDPTMPRHGSHHGTTADHVRNDVKEDDLDRLAWWLWFIVIASDWLIAAAYLAIPMELLFFWFRMTRFQELTSVLILFTMFISLCGTTHIASAFYDDTRYAKAIHAAGAPYPAVFLIVSKSTTAIVSVFTAIYTIRLIPDFLNMSARLEELQITVVEKESENRQQEREKDLERRSRTRVEKLHAHLDVSYILKTAAELFCIDFHFDRCTIVSALPDDSKTAVDISIAAEYTRYQDGAGPLIRPSERSVKMSVDMYREICDNGTVELQDSLRVLHWFPSAHGVQHAILHHLSPQTGDPAEQDDEISLEEAKTLRQRYNYILIAQMLGPGDALPPPATREGLSVCISHIQTALLQAQVLLIGRKAVQILRQRAELLDSARRQAETASRAKSDFIATMSHEIRTPMQAISALSDLILESDNAMTDNVRGQLEIIRSSSNILTAIINDILDFSKYSSQTWKPEMRKFNVRNLVEESLGIVAAHAKDKPRLELLYVLDRSVPEEVVSDGTRLMQVLVNLLHNALKNTDEGNIVVRVAARPLELPSASGQDTELTVSVKDTGIGIPPTCQQLLFKKFSQLDSGRHAGGLGLGLAICRKVVHKLHGRIWFESSGTAGEGTTFFFTVQVNSAEPRKIVATKGGALVIALSSVFVEQISEQLSCVGIKVSAAHSLDEALKASSVGMCPAGYPLRLVLVDVAKALAEGGTAQQLTLMCVAPGSPRCFSSPASPYARAVMVHSPATSSNVARCQVALVATPFNERAIPILDPCGARPVLYTPIRLSSLVHLIGENENDFTPSIQGFSPQASPSLLLSRGVPPSPTERVVMRRRAASISGGEVLSLSQVAGSIHRTGVAHLLNRKIRGSRDSILSVRDAHALTAQNRKGSQEAAAPPPTPEQSPKCRISDSSSSSMTSSSSSSTSNAPAPGSHNNVPAVLIVEDNVVNQQVFKALMRRMGVSKMLTALNGIDALHTIERDPAVDIILMDVNMPDMDGIACTKEIISRHGKNTYYIVGVSASTTPEDCNACLSAGMDDFLGKPAKLADLQSAFKRFSQSANHRRPVSCSGNDTNVSKRQ